MAKDLVSSETYVLESTVTVCNEIRGELINRYPQLWIYVYGKGKKSNSAYITVANSFGGKLEKAFAQEVVSFAKEIQYSKNQ